MRLKIKNLKLMALRGYVCVSVTNFLNCNKMSNNGWISNFKVSIEAYGHSASNYRFRIFKNQKTWWPPWIFHQNVTKITNSYKTANNGRILDFKVSIEAHGHSASNYYFRIFKFGLVWQPFWIFGQFWSILQTGIKRLIMDGFWILRCL